MNQTIALVTLAVGDLPRALAFYRDGLGWTPAVETEDIAFFQMNGLAFGLYRKEELEKEVGGPIAMGGRSVALSHNVASRDAVDAVLAAVRKLGGGVVVRDAIDHAWGGYSGYFEDADGHVWEVAWNPHWTYSPEGFVTL